MRNGKFSQEVKDRAAFHREAAGGKPGPGDDGSQLARVGHRRHPQMPSASTSSAVALLLASAAACCLPTGAGAGASSTAIIAACTSATDCRPEFQAALDRSPGGVVIPARDTPYPIREPGLWPRSHTVLTLEPGATLLAARGAFIEAPAGMFRGNGLSMIVLKDVENVSIVGHNATIRMHKEDYNTLPAYAPHPSAGRMGIILRNCSDIRIAGLTISHTGGDGIYIGRNHEPAARCCTSQRPPKKCANETTACHGVASNVHISDVRSLHNSRQGMSIVAGINITVERSEFSWTQGACPQVRHRPRPPVSAFLVRVCPEPVLANHRFSIGKLANEHVLLFSCRRGSISSHPPGMSRSATSRCVTSSAATTPEPSSSYRSIRSRSRPEGCQSV
jgi:hypothetical protein